MPFLMRKRSICLIVSKLNFSPCLIYLSWLILTLSGGYEKHKNILLISPNGYWKGAKVKTWENCSVAQLGKEREALKSTFAPFPYPVVNSFALHISQTIDFSNRSRLFIFSAAHKYEFIAFFGALVGFVTKYFPINRRPLMWTSAIDVRKLTHILLIHIGGL